MSIREIELNQNISSASTTPVTFDNTSTSIVKRKRKAAGTNTNKDNKGRQQNLRRTDNTVISSSSTNRISKTEINSIDPSIVDLENSSNVTTISIVAGSNSILTEEKVNKTTNKRKRTDKSAKKIKKQDEKRITATSPSSSNTNIAKEPGEKRLAMIRRSCSMKVKERIERAMSQRMFLVDRSEVSESYHKFVVLGSIGNVYNVEISTLPKCSCPDFSRGGNLCKHILFVYLKVLRVNPNSSYIYQKALLTNELRQIFQNAAPNPTANQRVRDKYAKIVGGVNSGSDDASSVKRPRQPIEGDCPICYEALSETEKLVWCKDSCGNNVHEVCFDQWKSSKRSSGDEITCVYCRNKWEDESEIISSSNDDGFINLGEAQGISRIRDSEIIKEVSKSLSASLFTEPLNISIGNPWDFPSSINGIDVSNILFSISALNKILNISGLSHATIEKIINLAVPVNSTCINRGEFNVALALVALAQKNMDVSIDNLVERKHDLPEPILTNIESIDFNRNLSFSNITSRPSSIPVLQDDDPWAISSTTNGIDIITSSPSTSAAIGISGSTFSPIISNTIIPRFPSDSNGASTILPSINRTLILDDRESHWFLDAGIIKVKFAPEHEESKVIRRYSDFWWLMECLVKRYPFRILPILPPKKIGVNVFYFTHDEAFLEKRRKGLARFLNFIARHPVLKNDDLVEMFLTEQTEIAVWRRNNAPDLDEEFLKKEISSQMEQRIPGDLNARLESVYNNLDQSIEHYLNMCNFMERIARSQEGTASDYMRYSLSLNSLIENEKGCFIENCCNCSQMMDGLEQVSSHFQHASTIMEDAATSILETVLEDLKRHRDLLLSFKDTFERRDRLVIDTSETLNNRISINQAKLKSLSSQKTSDPEVEKLASAIQKDEGDLKVQLRKQNFVRYCMHSELNLLHKSSAFVSLLYRNFINEQMKYTQQLYKNWDVLNPKVRDMPIETNGFG
nr:15784_t:CDS:10 [Entrophospora candida]